MLTSTWLCASSRDAAAFCRTRTDPVSSDDCAAQGPSLYWKNQCVTYALNKAASKKADLTKARTIVLNSFAAWTATNPLCTPGVRSIELAPTDTSKVGYDAKNAVNENIVVFRDDSWPYNDAGNPLALTTVTFNAETGEILDADIEVNSADKGVTAQEPLPATGYDLQSIITHEVGHFFGLAHSHVSGATMEPRYDRGQTGLRTLENDDQKGICTIYPSTDTRTTDQPGGASMTNVNADSCDTKPATPPPSYNDKGCACAEGPHSSSNAPLAAIALGAFATVIVRRRRR